MSAEKRIEYLLGAALRAEAEGARRTASALRRMAEEARELDAYGADRRLVPAVEPAPAVRMNEAA